MSSKIDKLSSELNGVNPITDEHLALLTGKNSFKTGSTVFGGSNPKESDVDIVVLSDDPFDSLDAIVSGGMGCYGDNDYTEEGDSGDDFTSVYCNHVDGTIYNFLFVRQSEFDVWKFATEHLTKSSIEDENIRVAIADKYVRIVVFQALKQTKRRMQKEKSDVK
jgi:hypothetical protein